MSASYSYSTVTVCRDCGGMHVVNTDHAPRGPLASDADHCRSRNWVDVRVPYYGVAQREDLGKWEWFCADTGGLVDSEGVARYHSFRAAETFVPADLLAPSAAAGART